MQNLIATNLRGKPMGAPHYEPNQLRGLSEGPGVFGLKQRDDGELSLIQNYQRANHNADLI